MSQLELFGSLSPTPAPTRPAARRPTPTAPAASALSAPSAIERWVDRLRGDRAVRVVFTDNRVVLVSLGGTGGTATLRVHRCLRDADDTVAEAVARLYLTTPRRPRRLELQRRLRTYVAAQSDGAPAQQRPPRSRGPDGVAHDLTTVLTRVAERWIPEPLDVVIGWSPRPARRVLARWHAVTEAPSHIVVNRLLDDPRVRPGVLDYLVFHEALHEVLRERQHGRRRVYHHAEFRRREREFPDFPAIGREAEELAERLWRTRRRVRTTGGARRR